MSRLLTKFHEIFFHKLPSDFALPCQPSRLMLRQTFNLAEIRFIILLKSESIVIEKFPTQSHR